MSWSKDSLWAKSKTLFEKAFEEDRDDIYFGLLCSIGLELLERAALANISPTLLAEQDDTQRNVLYALGHKAGNTSPKSIVTGRVIEICSKVIEGFTDDCKRAAAALANRRNEEAHTGAMAFKEYDSDKWLGGFFHVCLVLCESMGETLDSLFGQEIATEANERITTDKETVKKKVCDSISAHKKVFGEKVGNGEFRVEDKQVEISWLVSQKTTKGFHKVECPACGCDAVIHGHPAGPKQIEHFDDCVIERENILPNSFECEACGLKLRSYSELEAAGLPLHYTNRITYTPEEFYGFPEGDSDSEEEWWESFSNE